MAYPHTRSAAAGTVRSSFLLLVAALVFAGCTDLGTAPPLEPDLAVSASKKPKRNPRTPIETTTNPFAGATFYVEPYSNARHTADAWRATRPADAEQMDKIAERSQALWFGDWSGDVYRAVDEAMTWASSAGALPVFVAYNIPLRDCGSYSGGGSPSPDAYRRWISAFADAIGTRRAVVILEPDALALMDCLSAADQQTRIDLIRYAVAEFKAKGSTHVYIDAGHSRWHPTATIADRLTRADVANARGFALNVSNFQTNAASISYGEALSQSIGGKPFVIDTSRNGLGPTADNEWCNPLGRALGEGATAHTGNAHVDAFLWIKRPGESDGTCNGGPPAGQWWPEYALSLAQRAAY
jgi:endoglucanase